MNPVIFDRSFSRRRFLAVSSAVTLTAFSALAGCGPTGAATAGAASGSSSSAGPAAKEVKFASLIPGSGKLYGFGSVAQGEGFLKEELEKEGFTYSIHDLGASGGPAVNEAMTSGAIDMAIYGDFPAITAISKGSGVRIFASADSREPSNILATAKSGIKGVKDLKGKKVIAPLGTVPYKSFTEILALNGMSVKDMEIVNAASDATSVLSSGQADAMVSNAASNYYMEEKGIGKVVASTDDSPETQDSSVVLVGRTGFSDENPKAVRAVVRALQRAYEFAQDNPEKAWKDISNPSMPESVVKRLYPQDTFARFDPRFSEQQRKNLEKSVDYMVDNKLISKKISLDEAIDEGPLKSL